MYPLFTQELWAQRFSDQMRAAARDSLRSRRPSTRPGPLRRGVGRGLVQLGVWLVGHPLVR
jgi:uncharacterized lipoprotein YmbA